MIQLVKREERVVADGGSRGKSNGSRDGRNGSRGKSNGSRGGRNGKSNGKSNGKREIRKGMEASPVKTPFFSICIPAYNGEAFLPDCLGSVAAQTFTDWEVVVVDDESSDGTADYLESQDIIPAEKYTFLRGEHQGLLQTRMRLLRLARGTVIVTLDNDDMLLDPTALEQIHAAFAEYDCDVVMYNACRSLQDPSRTLINYERAGITGPNPLDFDKVRRGFHSTYYLNNLFLKAYRRGAIDPDRPYPDVLLPEDRLQCLQMLASCSSAALIDKPLYYYRENLSSITNKHYDLRFFEDQMVVEDEVDRMTREWGITDEERLHVRVNIVVGTLESIYRTVPDAQTRIELYRAVEASPHIDSLKHDGKTLGGVRLDRRMVLRPLLRREFEKLDRVLALDGKLKGPVWKMMGRKA